MYWRASITKPGVAPCGHSIKSWRHKATRDGLCPGCAMRRLQRDARGKK